MKVGVTQPPSLALETLMPIVVIRWAPPVFYSPPPQEPSLNVTLIESTRIKSHTIDYIFKWTTPLELATWLISHTKAGQPLRGRPQEAVRLRARPEVEKNSGSQGMKTDQVLPSTTNNQCRWQLWKYSKQKQGKEPVSKLSRCCCTNDAIYVTCIGHISLPCQSPLSFISQSDVKKVPCDWCKPRILYHLCNNFMMSLKFLPKAGMSVLPDKRSQVGTQNFLLGS